MRLALVSLLMITLTVGCAMDAGSDEWHVDNLSIARDGLNYAEVSGTVTLNSTTASMGSTAEVRYYQDHYETLIVTTEDYIGSDLENEGETQAFEISHYQVYVTPAYGGYDTVCAEFRASSSNHPDWTRVGCLSETSSGGAASVDVAWESSALLLVTISGIGEGTFGLVETGQGGGWYGEDCPDGRYCHTVEDGENSFRSVHESATGVPWNGTLQENETLMHEGAEEHFTWAVFDRTGLCAAVGGHEPEYYASAGC